MDSSPTTLFDATLAYLSLPLWAAKTFREHSEDSDELASRTGLLAFLQHDGPYEVDIDVEAIDGWVARHAGVPDRSRLNVVLRERLRDIFGWSEDWLSRRRDITNPITVVLMSDRRPAEDAKRALAEFRVPSDMLAVFEADVEAVLAKLGSDYDDDDFVSLLHNMGWPLQDSRVHYVLI